MIERSKQKVARAYGALRSGSPEERRNARRNVVGLCDWLGGHWQDQTDSLPGAAYGRDGSVYLRAQYGDEEATTWTPLARPSQLKTASKPIEGSRLQPKCANVRIVEVNATNAEMRATEAESGLVDGYCGSLVARLKLRGKPRRRLLASHSREGP